MTEPEISDVISPENIDKWQVDDAARAVETLVALLGHGKALLATVRLDIG